MARTRRRNRSSSRSRSSQQQLQRPSRLVPGRQAHRAHDRPATKHCISARETGFQAQRQRVQRCLGHCVDPQRGVGHRGAQGCLGLDHLGAGVTDDELDVVTIAMSRPLVWRAVNDPIQLVQA
eukprot:3243304-Pyramimonas_sp.AAC.1